MQLKIVKDLINIRECYVFINGVNISYWMPRFKEKSLSPNWQTVDNVNIFQINFMIVKQVVFGQKGISVHCCYCFGVFLGFKCARGLANVNTRTVFVFDFIYNTFRRLFADFIFGFFKILAMVPMCLWATLPLKPLRTLEILSETPLAYGRTTKPPCSTTLDPLSCCSCLKPPFHMNEFSFKVVCFNK